MWTDLFHTATVVHVVALAGFVISTRWGLFGYRETFWGSWQEAAGGLELAAALLVALLLASFR